MRISRRDPRACATERKNSKNTSVRAEQGNNVTRYKVTVNSTFFSRGFELKCARYPPRIKSARWSTSKYAPAARYMNTNADC